MRLFSRGRFTLLVLILFPLVAFAQNKPKNYVFEKLPPEVGFTNTGVNDILEDHRGFLWMATWSGLAKYDGYKVKMYRQQPGNSNGLKSNKVTQIYEDSKGTLWIGTNYTGFYRYNRDLDVFEQFCRNPEDMNSLSNDNVWAILEDQDGYLWIGTERGLNRFNPETKQFIHYKNDPTDSRSLSHDFVYSIAQTPDGSIWVGTEKGLNRLIQTSDEEYFIHYDLTPKDAVDELGDAHNFIYKIRPSNYDPNAFWVCTSTGLKKVHFSPSRPSDALSFESFVHKEAVPGSLSHYFIPGCLRGRFHACLGGNLPRP